MGSTDYDTQIAAAEERVAAAREELQNVVREFTTAVVNFAGPWFEDQARRAVESRPERAKELGVPGLRNVKNEVAALRARLPELADQLLVQGVTWPHEKANWDETDPWKGSLSMTGNRPPELLDKPVRSLLAELAPILVDQGLASEDEWRNARDNRRAYIYPFGVDWTPEMRAAVDRYDKVHREMTAANLERHDALGAKAQAEARNLWEQA